MKLLLILLAGIQLVLTSSDTFFVRERPKEKNFLEDSYYPFLWHKSNNHKRSVTVGEVNNSTKNETADHYNLEKKHEKSEFLHKKRNVFPEILNEPYPAAPANSFFKILGNDYRPHKQKLKERKRRNSNLGFLDIGFEKISNNPWKFLKTLHHFSPDKFKSKRSAEQLLEKDTTINPFKDETFYDVPNIFPNKLDTVNEPIEVYTTDDRVPLTEAPEDATQNDVDATQNDVNSVEWGCNMLIKNKTFYPDIFNITFSIMREINVFDDMLDFFRPPKLTFFESLEPETRIQTTKIPHKLSIEDFFGPARWKRQAFSETKNTEHTTLQDNEIIKETPEQLSAHDSTVQSATSSLDGTFAEGHNSSPQFLDKNDNLQKITSSIMKTTLKENTKSKATEEDLPSAYFSEKYTEETKKRSDVDQTTYFMNLKTLHGNKNIDPIFAGDISGQYNADLDDSQPFGNNGVLSDVKDNEETKNDSKPTGKNMLWIILGVAPGVIGIILVVGVCIVWRQRNLNLLNIQNNRTAEPVPEHQAESSHKPVPC